MIIIPIARFRIFKASNSKFAWYYFNRGVPSTIRFYSNQNKKCENPDAQVRNCKEASPPPPPCCPPRFPNKSSEISCNTSTDQQKPPPSSSNNKLLLSLLLAGGCIGLAYLYYREKDTSEHLSQISQNDSSASRKTPIPPTSKEIPSYVPFLLIGGGTASFAAFRAIKSLQPKAKVLVITDEYDVPYMRPPLSKEMWVSSEDDSKLKFKQWNGVERSIFYEPEEFYISPLQLMESPNGGVAVARGYTVERIDPVEKLVSLSDGYQIKYDECLLAPGSSPKNLDIFHSSTLKIKEKVSVYKNIQDFENLRKNIGDNSSIAIIGGGFLGSELACSIAKFGQSKNIKVYQIFHENGNMSHVLPVYLSNWTTERIRNEGVTVLTKNQVVSATLHDGKLKLRLLNGEQLLVDHVIVAVGSQPNTELASSSKLEVNNKIGGYVVNAELEARRNLFVAGDAACFYDPLLGRRRVEHHDHAVVSGRLAGENMVGRKKPYKHQSMFWSDLGPNLGYEAIGIIDSSLPTVGVYAKMQSDNDTESTNTPIKTNFNAPDTSPPNDEDYNKGVIFYLRNNVVVGIVLWNIFNRIGLARQVILEEKSYSDLNEVAKLFEIHN